MNVSLPSIKLGKDNSPISVFDFDHDVNTTSEFGFLQPVICQEMQPRSVFKLKMSQFIRLAAMNSPTFGRVSCNTYHRFVPISELLPTFEYLLSGQPYHTKDGNYIPSSMPYTSLRDLTLYQLSQNSIYCIYKLNSGHYDVVGGSGDITTIIGWINASFLYGGLSGKNARFDTAKAVQNIMSTQQNLPDIGLPNPKSCDFLMKYTHTSGSTTNTYLVCFRFTLNGRRFRKILIGCGFQLNLKDSTPISIMPLLAYYKVWFDLFAPKQTVTWTSTRAFKWLDRVRESNITNVASYYDGSSDWWSFLGDLLDCYYTQKPDFVSANLAYPSLNTTQMAPEVSKPNDLAMSDGANVVVNGQPTISQVTSADPLTRNKLLLINGLSKLINKNSIIGGKIADYLHVHYGADFGDDLNSYNIGQQMTDCKITEEMTTATTEYASTGEFVGKGIGASEGRKFTYRAKEFGYWISVMAIVPNSGYCQAVDGNNYHLKRFDFPNGVFDALGNEITRKSQVVGSQDVFLDTGTNSAGAESPSFGFIPRLTHCKVKHNIANGDISLRSTRATMLPYMLDRWITTNEVNAEPVDEGSTSYTVQELVSNIPIAGESWRYLTKYDYLGNFNRIFQTEGYHSQLINNLNPIPDNFVVHNLMVCKYVAPLLPISESYDTDGDDKDALEVTKA